MTWAITVATFLATVAAALVIVLFFFQREQFREALKERRIEKRIPTHVGLEIASLDEPFTYGKAVAENASRRGARIIADRPWPPKERVVIRLLPGKQQSRARIAYCSVLPEGTFAVGLRFSPSAETWLTAANHTSDNLHGR